MKLTEPIEIYERVSSARLLVIMVGLARHPDGAGLCVSTVGYGQGLVDGQPPEGLGQIVRIVLEDDEEQEAQAMSTAQTAK
jgi:hypothetical protein